MKTTKCSVAVVLVNPSNSEEFLIVKRPADDDLLPNVWGLPAVTLKNNELPEDAVKRVGKEKLNTEIEADSFIGIKHKDRGVYNFILMDIKARLMGEEPSVVKAKTENTKYVDQKWTKNLASLKEAAVRGSLCSQIFLESNNISY